MGLLAVAGSPMMCTFGMAPSTLVVLPTSRVLCSAPAGNILDSKPIVNIPPFGMCMSIANPMVASATAAALGVLTPMPCIPVTVAPWVPGSPTVMIGGAPALNSSCQLMCMWAGMISLLFPGQVTTLVP
jgi:hypothetical protein